jgi:hypothetical protein
MPSFALNQHKTPIRVRRSTTASKMCIEQSRDWLMTPEFVEIKTRKDVLENMRRFLYVESGEAVFHRIMSLNGQEVELDKWLTPTKFADLKMLENTTLESRMKIADTLKHIDIFESLVEILTLSKCVGHVSERLLDTSECIRGLVTFKRQYLGMIVDTEYLVKRITEHCAERTHTNHESPSQNTHKYSASILMNRGTGAGGSNTNYYGKKFEEKTNNSHRLLDLGYSQHSFTKNTKTQYDYLSKTVDDKTIVFVLQSGLKKYMKNKYNINLFRCPDEAYIIEYATGRKVIKILEKKEQNVEGSVETKLWSGPALKREYEIVLGNDFEIVYGFCVSDFLKNKLVSTEPKYTILNTIFNENNITVLFGDNENYFETVNNWINNSL